MMTDRLSNRSNDPTRRTLPRAWAEDPAGKLIIQSESGPAGITGPAATKLLDDLFADRARRIEHLRALYAACERFEGELGWDGRNAYAHDYVENAWRDARKSAAGNVWAVDRDLRPSLDPVLEASSGPEFARPHWRALLRIGQLSAAPSSHVADINDEALLRGAVAEFRVLLDTFGEEVVCPACERPGLWIQHAVHHVATCPAHPATVNRRASGMALSLAAAILRDKGERAELPNVQPDTAPRIKLLSPSALDASGRGSGARSYLDGRIRELETAIAAEKRISTIAFSRQLESGLADPLSWWQRYRVAAGSSCPYCGVAPGFAALLAHLVECPAHPDVSRASQHEAALRKLGVEGHESVAQLQRDADRARLATARLIEECDAFASLFGDDEGGRARISTTTLPFWNAARERARHTLAELDRGARSSFLGLSPNSGGTQ